jgi:hypothetical protein
MFRNIEEAILINIPNELRDLNIEIIDTLFEDELFVGIKSNESKMSKLSKLICESLIMRFKKRFKLRLHS